MGGCVYQRWMLLKVMALHCEGLTLSLQCWAGLVSQREPQTRVNTISLAKEKCSLQKQLAPVHHHTLFQERLAFITPLADIRGHNQLRRKTQRPEIFTNTEVSEKSWWKRTGNRDQNPGYYWSSYNLFYYLFYLITYNPTI